MPLLVRELSASEHHLWDHLVSVSEQRSLFVQRWWMEIVTQGHVRLYGCFDGERLLAGIQLWPCTTLGIPRLRQPPLTPYWGPILSPLRGDYHARIAGEEVILTALAEALAPWRDIAITCHPALTNWLGFTCQHFMQTTRYTYRIGNWRATSLEEATSHWSIYARAFAVHKNSV